jgi:membrane protease YdiL (CAAX protease family)
MIRGLGINAPRGERPYAVPPDGRLQSPGDFVGTVIVIILLQILMQVVFFLIGSKLESVGAGTTAAAVGVVLGHVVSIAYLYTRLRQLGYGSQWSAFGFRRIRAGLVLRTMGGAFLFGIFAIFIMATVQASAGEFESDSLPILAVPLPVLFFLAITVPVFEEILFRGYLLPHLLRFLQPRTALLATTVIFVLLHGPQTGWLPPALLLLTGLSLILGVLRMRFASLWVCVVFHQAYNTLLVSLALAAYLAAPPKPEPQFQLPPPLITKEDIRKAREDIQKARTTANGLLDNLAGASSSDSTSNTASGTQPR